ncbi:MAG: heme lyase CcmF/NrfE family subunit [Acidobacteriota bacterium]
MTQIGYLSLITALIVSAYASIFSFVGKKREKEEIIVSAENAALASFILLTLSSISLIYAFINYDFKLEYVASYSSRTLPLFYRIPAFWAGQKGSLLLWVWLLSIFTAIVMIQNKKQNRQLMPYVISILMFLEFFFLSIIVFISNPFEKLSFTPPDGQGLNPLLQNPGMLFHPPALYIGYVGFAIPFAFAIAALITGKLDDIWIRTTRRWTIFSWYFLGIGNLLGAQWAYVELGWGGYWAWDPVENASFMPWLTGTAFLHSVMIQEKRDMLKIWNMILIIITFVLTIFGTFIVRSGVLSSVHTFAQSPILGSIFLGLIVTILIFAFGLLFNRQKILKSKNELESILSRESSFLFNNLILIGAAFAILWGTIFPLISEAVRKVKITVGPPFFNRVTIPIFLVLLFITGLCPLIAWRRTTLKNLKKFFLYPTIIALTGISIIILLGIHHLYASVSFTLSIFVVTTIILEFYRGVRVRHDMKKENYLKAFFNLIERNKRRYGGYIVHLAMVLIFIGVTGSAFKVEKEASLKKGDSIRIKEYTLKYEDFSSYPTANKYILSTTLSIWKNNKKFGFLTPEKYLYKNEEQAHTEVDILSNLKEDLYVILAGFTEDGTASFKFFIEPLIAWIWIGGIVLTIGTIIIILPDKREKRYLQEKYRQAIIT